MIERATVTLRDEDGPWRWDLRVTEIFRCVDGQWLRVHRHADPFVERHDVSIALDLLME